jgi:hypothetical protein
MARVDVEVRGRSAREVEGRTRIVIVSPVVRGDVVVVEEERRGGVDDVESLRLEMLAWLAPVAVSLAVVERKVGPELQLNPSYR